MGQLFRSCVEQTVGQFKSFISEEYKFSSSFRRRWGLYYNRSHLLTIRNWCKKLTFESICFWGALVRYISWVLFAYEKLKEASRNHESKEFKKVLNS